MYNGVVVTRTSTKEGSRTSGSEQAIDTTDVSPLKQANAQTCT